MSRLPTPSVTSMEEPSWIDRWLNIVTRKPGVISFQEEHVVCLIERVCAQAPDDGTIFVDPPTYTLYITARVSLSYALEGWQQSPQAVLDQFVGWPNEHCAPQWMRWSRSSVFFQHRIPAFTKLFIELSNRKFNVNQPSLPLKMVAWARSIAEQAQRPGPRTPQARRVSQSTPIRKRDALFYLKHAIDRSPTSSIAQCTELCWDMEDSEDMSDIEPSIARLLDFGSPPIPFSDAQPRPDFDDEFNYPDLDNAFKHESDSDW